MIRGIIDRFEGKIAVLTFDDADEWAIDRSLLPSDAGEGTAITVTIAIDSKATASLKDDIGSIQDRLRRKA